MAEDQGEPGQTALGSADNDKPTESRKLEEQQSKQSEKLLEPVKETHEDDDLESSQSLNLVLEDPEENEEQRLAAVDKGIETKEPELAEKTAADVDAGSSKVDDKEVEEEEERKLLLEDEDEEKTEEEVKVLKNETEKKEEEVEKLPEDTKLDAGTIVKEPETKKDDQLETKKDDAVEEETEPKKLPEVETKPEKIEPKAEESKVDADVAEIKEEPVKESSSSPSPEKKKKNKKQPEATASLAVESEVGIVGPPTAACDLLSDAELVAEKSSLPTDETKTGGGGGGGGGAQVSERVVRWVENTAAKADDPSAVLAQPEGEDAEEEEEEEMDGDDDDNDEQEDEEEEELDGEEGSSSGGGGTGRTRGRKRRASNGTNGSPSPANRKSRKVVGSIIRRSIRW